MKAKIYLTYTALLGLIVSVLPDAFGQTTAFTYQGKLNNNGTPTTGIYDLRFTIFDSPSNGNSLAAITNSPTGVTNGLFTVQLDFGANIFNGSARWLDIAVRTNGSVGSFTSLTPRQPFTATPYAIQAANAAAAVTAASVPGSGVTGQISDAHLSTNVALLNGNARFTGAVTANSFVGDGQSMTNVFISSLVTWSNAVRSWGNDSWGQSSPPPTSSPFIAISCGSFHTIGLKSNGTVSVWGDNYFNEQSVPAGLDNVVAISAGGYHGVALKNNGTVIAWGFNDYGQTNVPALTGITKVAGGLYHSLALKNDGTVVGWGGNFYGETTPPPGLSNVIAIAAGSYRSLALRNDGSVIAWGESTYVPANVSNIIAIAAGAAHYLALKNDGTVLAWGTNTSGQLNVPANLTNVVAISSSDSHSLALKQDGTVVGWGWNDYGQASVPEGLSNVLAISAGGWHSAALFKRPTLASIARLDGDNVFNGSITINGTITGNGNGLTNLNATNLTGSLPDSVLSTNVALRNANQSFSGVNIFKNPGNSFTGNGAGLSNVTATTFTGTISSNNIAAGTITGAMLANGAVTSNHLAADSVTASKLFTTFYVPLLATIPNPTVAAGDQFGVSVAAVGSDKVLIGAHKDDTGAANAGAAYLFRTDGVLLTTFTNPTPGADDLFGYAVAAVGSDKVIIGAPYEANGANWGTAYLFSTNGALLRTFERSSYRDKFGMAVAGLGSDTVIIGAPDTGNDDNGRVDLFDTNGVLLRTFNSPAPYFYERFGMAVAGMGPDKLLIGAKMSATVFGDRGVVYLYNTNGLLLTTFNNPSPDDGDLFGSALAVVGSDKVLIGAHSDDTLGPDAGAAFLFSTNGTLLTTFTNPAPTPQGDHFGCSIAGVGSDKVLIGAWGNETGAVGTGAAYLFSTNGTLLTIITNPAPADFDEFGTAVTGVASNKVLIAAYSDDLGATNAGTAYLFSFVEYAPGVVSEGVTFGSIGELNIADGAITQAKLNPTLYTNLAFLNASQTFTGANTFNNAGNSFTGNGSGLTNLNAGNLSSGTLADARLSSNVALRNANQTFSGNNTFSGTSTFSNQVGIGAAPYGGGPKLIVTSSTTNAGDNTANFSAPAIGGNVSHIHYGTTGDWYLRSAANSGKVVIQDFGGNVAIGHNNPLFKLHVQGDIYASGSIVQGSDRNIKTDIETIEPASVLEKVAALPISQWRYKEEREGVKHMGPMAQDFHEAFGLGINNTSITTVDESGVALAAIKGLNQKLSDELKRRDAENAELKQRLLDLEQLVHELKEQK